MASQPDRSRRPLPHGGKATAGVLIACLVLLAAGCAVSSLPPDDHGQPAQLPSPTFPDPTAPPFFAYLTDVNAEQPGKFVLMRGSQVIAQDEGIFGTSTQLDNIIWTLDGRYAVAINNGKPTGDTEIKRNSVVALDSQTGEVRKLPCPMNCISVAAIEGSKVFTTVENGQNSADEGLSLLQLDVSSSDPPVLLKTKLPNRPADVLFMASVPGYVLVRAPDSADFLSESIYVMNAAGSVRQLEHDGENFTVRLSVGITRDTDGKPMIALYESPAANALGPADKLVLLDPATNTATDTNLSPLHQAAGELPQYFSAYLTMHDLWWSKDGHLYATWSVFVDDGNGGEEPQTKVPPTLWRLDGVQWTQVNAEQVRAVRQLNATTKAVLIPENPEDSHGTLYVDEAGKRTQVADKVLAIVAPV